MFHILDLQSRPTSSACGVNYRVVVDAEVDPLADPRDEAVALVRLREDEQLVEKSLAVVLDGQLLGKPSLHRNLTECDDGRNLQQERARKQTSYV